MGAPGAKMSVVALLLLKQVTWSAAVVASTQPSAIRLPTFESQTAPTEMTLAMQAGAGIDVPDPWLPLEAKRRTPLARKVSTATASVLVRASDSSQCPRNRSLVPRLMLTILTSG